MYIDLIVLIVLCILVILFFRNFKSFVFFIAIFDILLRILLFIREHIPLTDIKAVMAKYLPTGILGIIGEYTTGILATILSWCYLIIMVIFLCYIIKIFFTKKRR